MLMFFKPIIHQGPGADLDDYDAPKKKKKKRKKVTKRFVEQTAAALELPVVDVQPYIENMLKREEELEQQRSEQKIAEMIEQIGQMVKKSLAAKRKRLNMMIASILDWL